MAGAELKLNRCVDGDWGLLLRLGAVFAKVSSLTFICTFSSLSILDASEEKQRGLWLTREDDAEVAGVLG